MAEVGATRLRDAALDILKRAAEADSRADYTNALSLYQKGVEHMFAASKYERSEKLRALMLGKCKEMLTRAESIKECLATQDSEKSAKKMPAAASDMDERLAEALRSSIVIVRPSTTWNDIAGLNEAKQALREAVELPINAPQLFLSKRLEAWTGILLYGPPGTGKTQLARAVANSIGTVDCPGSFLNCSASDLCSRYVGDSERLVRQLFRIAREQKPTVIFIDEIDSLVSSRTEGENDSALKIKTEFLQQMDGIAPATGGGVLVLAATNRPWTLDRAILRRFEKKIMIPLPNMEGRKQVLQIHLAQVQNSLTSDDIDLLARATEEWSGSELRGLIKEASFLALRALHSANYFRKVFRDEGVFCVLPCAADDPDAEAMTLADVEKMGWMKLLELPPVSIADLLTALGSSSKGGSAQNTDDAHNLQMFTDACGMMG